LIECTLLECEYNWAGECKLLVNEKEKKLLKPNSRSCPFFTKVPDEVLRDREAFLELEDLLFEYIESAIDEISTRYEIEPLIVSLWASEHIIPLHLIERNDPYPFSESSEYLEWKERLLNTTVEPENFWDFLLTYFPLAKIVRLIEADKKTEDWT